ncbi:hypothetical protein L7F22_002267 [Adiantum nelumboides]|nr:hypothetical protein [Adiantum nelumboides]
MTSPMARKATFMITNTRLLVIERALEWRTEMEGSKTMLLEQRQEEKDHLYNKIALLETTVTSLWNELVEVKMACQLEEEEFQPLIMEELTTIKAQVQSIQEEEKQHKEKIVHGWRSSPRHRSRQRHREMDSSGQKGER